MNAHIQAYLRDAASRARDTERIGPFLATFSRGSANPYLNYAIPDLGADPSSADIAALIAAYQRRERRPRLEYIADLAPAVEAALVADGFTIEGRLPLMVCPPDGIHDLPVPPGIELLAPTSDAEILALIGAQNEAYGEAAPDPSAVEGRKANLVAGGMAILARDVVTGEAVGGGQCDVPAGGVTELTSVGVRAPYRRRGIAGALTTRLAQDAFAAGVATVFLMAAHQAEERIYARAGFSTIGDILHISLPS
ncbi:MAG: GNAT family N-acetyltransferase [Chloroflexota bacterium]